MKISFNDKSLHTTFEYPSESSLAQEEAEEEEEEEGEEDGEEEEVGPDSEKPFTVFSPRATFVSSVGPESSSGNRSRWTGQPGSGMWTTLAGIHACCLPFTGLSSYTPKHSMAFSKWQEQTLVQTPTDVELPPKEVMVSQVEGAG